MKILKQQYWKGRNVRVIIELAENENGTKFFGLRTKRLIDFKTRNITQVCEAFSIETFLLIHNATVMMLDSDIDRFIKEELEPFKKYTYDVKRYVNNENKH